MVSVYYLLQQMRHNGAQELILRHDSANAIHIISSPSLTQTQVQGSEKIPAWNHRKIGVYATYLRNTYTNHSRGIWESASSLSIMRDEHKPPLEGTHEGNAISWRVL